MRDKGSLDMKKLIVIAAALLVGGPALASDLAPLAVGDWVITRVTPYTAACPTEGDLSRAAQLYLEGDHAASDAFIDQHCKKFPLGTEVIIERDDSGWSHMICVRPRGETECLWVGTHWVESKADYGTNGAPDNSLSYDLARKARADCEAAGGNFVPGESVDDWKCVNSPPLLCIEKDGSDHHCRDNLARWRKEADDCEASGGNFLLSDPDGWKCVKP